jgi:hypothetical protein
MPGGIRVTAATRGKPSDLSQALIGRERGEALAGRASRQNSVTADAACVQQVGIPPSIQQPALAQWDKSLEGWWPTQLRHQRHSDGQ